MLVKFAPLEVLIQIGIDQGSKLSMVSLRVISLCPDFKLNELSFLLGDHVTLTHCEYGNTETLHKSKLRVLDDKFLKVGELVVPSYFAIKAKNEKSLMAELKAIFDEGSKEFQFKKLEKFLDGWILEPIDMSSNKNVIDTLVGEKKVERVSSEELKLLFSQKTDNHSNQNDPNSKNGSSRKGEPSKKTSKSQKSDKSTNSVEPSPKTVKVETAKKSNNNYKELPQFKITAITSATDFFTVRADDFEIYKKLHSDIQIIASGMAELDNIHVSTFCLVQQPFDGLYYRAQVIYSDEIVTVRCLDDGKTFSVDKKLLKQMPEALKAKKYFATASSLCVSVVKAKEEEATDFLMKNVDKLFAGKVLWETENQMYIELFNDELNLSDQLISLKLATPVELIQNGSGFTSHINSISSFYLQMEYDQLKLDAISKYIEESEKTFQKVEGVKGQIVAAKFEDDGCWYRAEILSKRNNKYLVSFIDFGNICECDQIGLIEETIAKLPRMSKHCKLHVDDKQITLPTTIDEDFKTFCANGATILRVTMIKPGDPIEVSVSIDGSNLIDMLLSKK